MKGKKFISVGIIALMLFGAFTVLINTETENVKAENSENVSFNLDFTYVTATYSPTISIPTKNVEPNGGSTNAEINANAGMMTITLTVPNVGSADLDINPLGEHSYDVPGLYYDYGVAQFGIELYVKGTITGNPVVTGSGNTTTGMLMWDSSGSKTVQITSSSDSQDGDTITLTLDDIEYSLWIKVTASGDIDIPFVGTEHKEFTLIDYQKLGSIQGNPSSVSGTIYVKTPQSGISSMFGSLTSPGTLGLLLLLAVIAIVAVAYHFRKKKKLPPTEENIQEPQVEYYGSPDEEFHDSPQMEYRR